MQSFTYDPNNLDPYTKLISNKDRNEKQELCVSLSKYDSRLSFSDFKLLNLHGTPRDTSKFYKHSRQNLYLRRRFVQGKIEWTNVTTYYDWDKIETHPEIPMFKFRKENILTRCLNYFSH